MAATEQFYLSGTYPNIRVEIVSPNGSVARLMELGGTPVEPVIGDIALLVPCEGYAVFEGDSTPDVRVDDRYGGHVVAQGAGGTALVGFS